LHLVLDSIIFNLNINTKFLELYTSCNFISKIQNRLMCYVMSHDLVGLDIGMHI